MAIGVCLCLLSTLLLGATFRFPEGGSGGGFQQRDEGSDRMPGWGSGEGAVFASKCILKVEYAKGAYIPGLEITRFAPEFRGFWQKLGFECNNSL